MSTETSGKAIQEFKDALEGTNETNNEPTPIGKAGAGDRKSKPGGASRVPPKGEGASRVAPAARESAGGARGELRTNLKDKETPPITEIIPELKEHPEIAKKMKDLGFEDVLQKEWMRQNREQAKTAEG